MNIGADQDEPQARFQARMTGQVASLGSMQVQQCLASPVRLKLCRPWLRTTTTARRKLEN